MDSQRSPQNNFILFIICLGDIFRDPALENVTGPSKSKQDILTAMVQDPS